MRGLGARRSFPGTARSPVLLGIVTLCAGGLFACSDDPGDSVLGPRQEGIKPLSASDAEEIVHRTVEIAILEGELPESYWFSDIETLYVSTRNIEADWLPRLDGHVLAPMTPDQIQARADSLITTAYFSFDALRRARPGLARVVFGYQAAVRRNSGIISLWGGWLLLEFTAAESTWTGRIIDRWQA